MFEAYDYISSEHFVDLLEENRSLAACEPRNHGYTCFVETDSHRESFAVIKEGTEETYVYYDTQAARKRTRLHPTDGRQHDTDHVSARITDAQEAPCVSAYLDQHEDRLTNDRDESPNPPLLGAFGKDDDDRLHDVILGEGTPTTATEIRDAFQTVVEKRRQSLHAGDASRHDTFGKMFGWRIEPLEQRDQPDIVLELLLLGAYEQVCDAIDPP